MKAPSIGYNAVSLITQKTKLYSEKNHLLKASAAVRAECRLWLAPINGEGLHVK